MNCDISDHLQLNVFSPFIKSAPSSSPNNHEVQYNQTKHLKHSTLKENNILTIVPLSKNKEHALTKKKGTGEMQGRKCIKKMTSKFLRPSNLNSKRRKENIMTKQQLSSHIDQSEEKKNLKKKEKKIYPMEFLQIKSLNLNQQLNKIKSQKKRHRSSVKNQKTLKEKASQQSSQVHNIKQNNYYQPESIQSSAIQISENLECKSIEHRFHEQSKSKGKGFYDKLKERLSLQIKQIKDKQLLNQTEINITRCHMKQFSTQQINLDYRTSLTQRARPRTALTKVGLENQKSNRTIIQKKRPQSSSSKILEKKEIAYLNEKIDKEKEKQINNFSQLNTSRQVRKKSKVYYIPDQTTLKHVNKMHKRQNWTPLKGELQRQKLKEKMLKILIQCHSESEQKFKIDQGVQIFQKYCQKMNGNLQKTSRMIKNVQETVTIQQQVQYL